MVALESHGRSRHSMARRSHRLPVTDTEIRNGTRFVSVETCLETCRAEFVASGLGVKPGVAFADVCSILTWTQPREVFWKLYCCDSSRCGVHIDRDGPLEQSPNVDLLINQCKDHGFYDIFDPGPPAITCRKPSSFVLPAQPSPFPSSSIPSFPASTHREPPAPARSNLPDSTNFAFSTGRPASYAPAIAAQHPSSSPGGLSRGAKVVIGICCAVATIALLAALWLVRRRRRSNRGYLKSPPSPRHPRTRAEPEPQSGSHRPLLTPLPSSSPKKMPVTPPPPRLSDRRYLVSMALGPGSALPGRRSSPADPAFPRAPVCSPTGKKLVPRPASPTAASPSGNRPPPAQTHRVPHPTGAPRDSPHGRDGTPGASSPAAEDKNARSPDPASLPGTPPSSPSRPRRPQGGLLEVETVRPASESPTWALPTPPQSVQHTRAPASPVLPVLPLSTTSSPNFPTTPSQAAPRPQPSGMVAAPEPGNNPPASRGAGSGLLTGSSSEFNEPYARKKRDPSVSWGSWGGRGAGGQSRGADKRPQGVGDRKETGGAAMPLQELNLEALGGSY